MNLRKVKLLLKLKNYFHFTTCPETLSNKPITQHVLKHCPMSQFKCFEKCWQNQESAFVQWFVKDIRLNNRRWWKPLLSRDQIWHVMNSLCADLCCQDIYKPDRYFICHYKILACSVCGFIRYWCAFTHCRNLQTCYCHWTAITATLQE